MKKKDKGEDAVHPAQAFVVERIRRSQIKNASYNPRKIDDHARKKLKENLDSVGLVEPPVWNRRTGNLVSGHQRMSILDDLSKVGDRYVLDVAVVDLSEKEEKLQNIFLNNPGAQGTYDGEALGKMIAEDKLDYEDAGFDKVHLELVLDDTDYTVEMFDTDNAPKSVKDDLEQLAEIQRMKRERKEHRARDQEANDPEFFAVVVFPDRDAQGEFMQRVGMNKDDRYVDGVRLHSSLEVAKPQTRTKGGEQFEALTFWVAKDQKTVIEDELTRIAALLKGKNIRGRALEAMAVISSQTPTDNITGEEPEEEEQEPAPKRKRKVS